MGIRCWLGHDWGEWVEVGRHLESKCKKCPRVRVRYPRPSAILAGFAVDLARAYIEWKYRVPIRRARPVGEV